MSGNFSIIRLFFDWLFSSNRVILIVRLNCFTQSAASNGVRSFLAAIFVFFWFRIHRYIRRYLFPEFHLVFVLLLMVGYFFWWYYLQLLKAAKKQAS